MRLRINSKLGLICDANSLRLIYMLVSYQGFRIGNRILCTSIESLEENWKNFLLRYLGSPETGTAVSDVESWSRLKIEKRGVGWW
jgi:hypothetical protein